MIKDCWFSVPDHKVEASVIRILWAHIWQTTICLRAFILQPRPLPKPVQTWWLSLGIYAFSLATPCWAAVSWQAKSSGCLQCISFGICWKRRLNCRTYLHVPQTEHHQRERERGQHRNRQCRKNLRSVQTGIRCPRICGFTTNKLPFLIYS